MKDFIQKYRLPLALTILLAIMTLMVAARYNLFFLAAWTQNKDSQNPVNITATPLQSVNKPINILRTGSIENAASTPITAGFSGRISEIYTTAGQSVKAGQPLFKIEATAESAKDSETSTVSGANQRTGAPQQTQANYDSALREFNRLQKLYDQGAIPRRQLENASARLQEAQDSSPNGQSDQSPVSTANTSQANGSVTINSPIDGRVTSLSAALGQTVQAEQQLMALGSGQEIEIVIPLEQQDLYLVHLGTLTTIGVANQTVTGKVSAIYPEVKENHIAAFLAHIALSNNPAGSLTPGMPIPVQINTGETVAVTAVPSGSIIQDDQGRNFIYIANNGRAVKQQISIGEVIGEFTEITSELPQSSLIITSNLADLKDGATINNVIN